MEDWTASYERWSEWEDPDDVDASSREAGSRSKDPVPRSHSCSHDHRAEQAIMDLSESEKEAASEDFRARGNAFFEEGQFRRAALHYRRALVYHDYAFPENEEAKRRMEQLWRTCMLNSAACFIKAGEVMEAQECCDQVLAADPSEVKGLYRRAQVHLLRDDFERAEADLAAGLALSESDPTATAALRRELGLLRCKEAAYRANQKELGALMFGGGAGGGGGKDGKKGRLHSMAAVRGRLYHPIDCAEDIAALRSHKG
jgi:tetratricopeptide (TPR) repeat protein